MRCRDICRVITCYLLGALLLAIGLIGSEADADSSNGPIPMFTFVFDDGNDTDYLIGKDIFSKHDVVACSAITTGFLNTPRHMSAEQVLELRDSGWEILSHTVSHPDLSGLDRKQIEVELTQSRAALKAIGIDAKNLVYPFNKNNDTVRELAVEVYRSGRGGRSRLNVFPLDRSELKSYSFDSDLDEMKRLVDEAYKVSGWLILYHHQFDAKMIVRGITGTFQHDEEIRFSPSGAIGRFDMSLWFPLYGHAVYFSPLAGSPQPGDMATGLSSGATRTVDRIEYNDRDDLDSLLTYIRGTYPAMRILTLDQALDAYDAYKSSYVGMIQRH